jgi:hypothetical protein
MGFLDDKDEFGLGKLEKNLNKSLSFDLFKESKKKQKKTRNFAQPKPQYTKKQKNITKEDIESARKFAKETGSAFGKIISNIKNRKIRKLEKETLKNIQLAEDMAHELKTLQNNNEALTDIARYEKELIKERQELKERKGQLEDKSNSEIQQDQPVQGCIRHPTRFNPKCSKCLEWAESLE